MLFVVGISIHQQVNFIQGLLFGSSRLNNQYLKIILSAQSLAWNMKEELQTFLLSSRTKNNNTVASSAIIASSSHAILYEPVVSTI